MLNKFTLSVIIPVYNNVAFIEKAINSVLSQSEVTEIVVVNDGSSDGTEDVLKKLQKKTSKIKVYFHENKCNKGRSASRNLGITKATEDYIAFLDADDYYLEKRFSNDKILFEETKDIDGVYNAVGFHFYRESSEQELKTHKIYTVTQNVEPENLFNALLYGKHGHFHIDGLTVKRSVFDSVGLFNETLVVAEDTDIFWKMAITSKLYTGVITEPLAVRGVHDGNIFDQSEVYKIYTLKMYEELVKWCSMNNIKIHIIDDLYKWIWIIKEKQGNTLWQDIKYWVKLFFPLPKLLFSTLSIKYFPVIRLRQKLFPFLFK